MFAATRICPFRRSAVRFYAFTHSLCLSVDWKLILQFPVISHETLLWLTTSKELADSSFFLKILTHLCKRNFGTFAFISNALLETGYYHLTMRLQQGLVNAWTAAQASRRQRTAMRACSGTGSSGGSGSEAHTSTAFRWLNMKCPCAVLAGRGCSPGRSGRGGGGVVLPLISDLIELCVGWRGLWPTPLIPETPFCAAEPWRGITNGAVFILICVQLCVAISILAIMIALTRITMITDILARYLKERQSDKI